MCTGFEGPNLNVRVLFKCRFLVFMTQYFCTQKVSSVTEHSLPFHPDVSALISIRDILSPGCFLIFIARGESWWPYKNLYIDELIFSSFYYSQIIMEMYI